MAEVNESMRRLGLGGGGGELNITQFDVCSNLNLQYCFAQIFTYNKQANIFNIYSARKLI